MKTLSVESWSLPDGVDEIGEMRRRLRATRLPRSIHAGWSGGINLDFLERFTAHLSDGYSWTASTTRYDDQHLMIRDRSESSVLRHGVHVTLPFGVVENAQPLIFLHGWPSSSFEFARVVRCLVDKRIFPVLIDLPGFGFSEPTSEPIGPRAMANTIAQVLICGLGLEHVIVHGNDWGSTVASWLAIDHPQLVRGIHLTMMGLRPSLFDGVPEADEEERAWIKTVQKRLVTDAGYREIQGTKGNTAAIGLSDSPAALAAWMAEKFHGWTTDDEHPDSSIALDDLATLVTGYWISGNVASANWIYAAVRQTDDTAAPKDGTGKTPVGLSFFNRGFFPPPPKSWPRRIHDVVSYEEHDRGGHYPALTEPYLLSKDLIQFCEALR